jgi:hypothetical protein
MAVHEICRLAEITGAPEVRQRALDAIHAAVHFVSPSLDEEGLPCMRKEEIISARITKWPGRVDYVCDEFAAAVLKDPIAVRAAQLAIEQGHPRSVLEEGNAHFVSSVKDALLNTEHFQAMLSLPPATCRLPMEDGEPDFAWADEQAGVVVAKHQGARLYMSLNWRRGFKDNKRDPQHVWVNNIARVHYTTPTLDRIATVAMESPHSFGRLYICRYGKFLIGMNLSEDASHDLDIPADAGTAEDLVSGRRYAAGTRAAIAPVTTLVIWIGGGE